MPNTILKQPPIYDFSAYEDNIKWDQMIGDKKPIAVIMRASIQEYGKRIRYEDAKVIEYITESKKRGFKTGLYHVLSPNGIAEQAALFINVWEKCGGADIEPIVDVEVDLVKYYPHATRKGESSIGQAVWQDHIIKFINAIAIGTGRTPMIYTNENYWKFVMTKNVLGQFVPPTWTSDYRLWVAQYPYDFDLASKPPRLPSGWTDYVMWQYHDKGRQNGFLANDLNVPTEAFAKELGSIIVLPPPDPTGEIPAPWMKTTLPDGREFYYDLRSSQ